MSRVDLIVPTYNGREHLRRCLEAVRNQTMSDFNVIVVDDGSTDGSAGMVEAGFPGYRLLLQPGNHGFATTYNADVGAGTAEYVALLNNDAFPEPDWLERLIDAAARYPDAAAFASKVLLADGSRRIHAAGDSFSKRGLPANRGVWEVDEGQFDAEEEVFSACAAAALYRRSAIDDLLSTSGYVFDVDFFMYCEDIDLAWRLRLLGYSIIYIPTARATHELSTTGGGSLASYFVARNNFAVLAKNLPSGLQRRVWPRFLARQFRQLLEALTRIREPAARARLRGILAGPWFALRQLRKRRAVQRSRRTALGRIESLLAAE